MKKDIAINDVVDQTTVRDIQLELRLVGEDKPLWEKNQNTIHFKYRIKITHNNKSVEFTFWGSAADWTERKHSKAVDAFEAVLHDALAYVDAPKIDDFAAEFRYEKPSDLLRTFTACKATLYKFKHVIGVTEEEIGSLLGEIQEV